MILIRNPESVEGKLGRALRTFALRAEAAFICELSNTRGVHGVRTLDEPIFEVFHELGYAAVRQLISFRSDRKLSAIGRTAFGIAYCDVGSEAPPGFLYLKGSLRPSEWPRSHISSQT